MSQKGSRLSTVSSQGLAKAEISETSSTNHHSLLRAVLGAKDREKLDIGHLKELSKLPDRECNSQEMTEAIQGLIRYIKDQESFTTGTSHSLRKSNSAATRTWQGESQIKNHRDELVREQEVLREEILALAERLKSLEALRDCLGLEEEGVPETTGRKRWKRFQLTKLKNQNKTVQDALVEMGLVQRLTQGNRLENNDSEVRQKHFDLIQAQAKCIEELNKYELLQLKKPKYTLLMNKILE